MGVAPPSPQQPLNEDPDDFRPGSSWRLVVDPDGEVDMAVIYESIGVGDRIPRHWHDVDEVIIIERGDATVHVGGADLDVSDGATVFVPAGTVHERATVARRRSMCERCFRPRRCAWTSWSAIRR